MTDSPSPAASSPDASGTSGTSSTSGPSGTGLALWQQTLAAEHAVIWGYGLVGATSGLDAEAQVALDQHRARRGTCIEAITTLGGIPVASEPAYEMSRPADEAQGRRTAAELEARTNIAYVTLAAADDRSARLLAAHWLREGAVTQTRWSGQVPGLPGLPS